MPNILRVYRATHTHTHTQSLNRKSLLTVSWHLLTELKFWATQSIKYPTRGEDHNQLLLQAEAKWIFDLSLQLQMGSMSWMRNLICAISCNGFVFFVLFFVVVFQSYFCSCFVFLVLPLQWWFMLRNVIIFFLVVHPCICLCFSFVYIDFLTCLFLATHFSLYKFEQWIELQIWKFD